MFQLYLIVFLKLTINQNKMKALIRIFWFRFFAVFDVLFSEKFELTTWNKDGFQTSQTKFWRSEIKKNIK